jgi:hypothetical protein
MAAKRKQSLRSYEPESNENKEREQQNCVCRDTDQFAALVTKK